MQCDERQESTDILIESALNHESREDLPNTATRFVVKRAALGLGVLIGRFG